MPDLVTAFITAPLGSGLHQLPFHFYGGYTPEWYRRFTKEAGLHYDVSVVTVSSATLTGYLNNTGSEAGMLPLIANSKWNQVVMQDHAQGVQALIINSTTPSTLYAGR